MKTNVNTLLLLGITFLLTSCGNTGKEEKESPMIVNVANVMTMPETKGREYPFISKPFRTSELSFRISGPLQQFEVYPGNYYAQGMQIAGIDPRDFRIRKERAEAVYNQANAEFERIRVLFEKNNISASAFEKAKADCITARTAFETASNELADSRLIAPFNGYVGEVYVENYQDVKASQPVLSFIDMDRLKIEAYVTQEMALSARNMDSVQICFDALPEKTFRAKVVEVSKGTSQNNLSYVLTAVLSNSGRELLTGMSGKMYLDARSSAGNNHLSIPQTALCNRPTDGEFVWTVEAATGKISKRKVVTGELLPDGYVTVTDGLQADEQVAVSGLRFLSDGMIVKTSQRK